MSQQDVEVLETFLHKFKAGDLAGCKEMVHPDIVIREADSLPYAGDFHGHEGLDKLLSMISADFQMQLDDFKVFDGGERVIGRMQTTFTSNHTGRSMPMTIVEIHIVRDGMLADMDIYYKDTKPVVDMYHEGRKQLAKTE